MKVYSKFPRVINVKDGEQINLVPGFHTVDDRLSDHWFFKALVVAGDVMVMDQESAPKQFEKMDIAMVDEKKEKPVKFK